MGSKSTVEKEGESEQQGGNAALIFMRKAR